MVGFVHVLALIRRMRPCSHEPRLVRCVNPARSVIPGLPLLSVGLAEQGQHAAVQVAAEGLEEDCVSADGQPLGEESLLLEACLHYGPFASGLNDLVFVQKRL